MVRQPSLERGRVFVDVPGVFARQELAGDDPVAVLDGSWDQVPSGLAWAMDLQDSGGPGLSSFLFVAPSGAVVR